MAETNIKYDDVVPGVKILIELKIELVRDLFVESHKVPKIFEGTVLKVETNNQFKIIVFQRNVFLQELTDCVICQCEIEEKGVITACNHKFHKKCLKEWRQQSNQCPLCNKQINKTKRHICYSNSNLSSLKRQTKQTLKNVYDFKSKFQASMITVERHLANSTGKHMRTKMAH